MLQYGKSWLEKEVQKYYQGSNPPGLSASEFVETIVTMLKSSHSNDELQNEVSECNCNDNGKFWVMYSSFFQTSC
jgi:hypothetical protein